MRTPDAPGSRCARGSPGAAEGRRARGAGGSEDGRHPSENRFEMNRRNMPRPQHDRLAARAVDDGRFDADLAGAAVEDQGHALTEFFSDVRRGGRADAAEAVGRRRGDAGGFAIALALGAGKAAQQLKRHRMAGHAQADGILAAGHGIGYPGLLFQDQGQRAGPEGFHQLPGDGRHLLGPMVDGVVAGQMDDQRVVGRTPLGSKYLGDRCRVGGIRPQAVDRLGRDGDQFAGNQQVDGTQIIGVARRHQSLMPMAARAASAEFCTCSALSPMTVKWPILRPGRAWCLP